MRHYYVKGEYEKLCAVIEMGLEQIASPPSNKTDEGKAHLKSRTRFIQEIGKTKAEDDKLYREEIRPLFLSLVLESPHHELALQ